MFELSSYAGLFIAALGAATLLPLQSETVLAAMLISGHYSTLGLVLVATLGNVLGAVLNWLLGRSIERLRHKRWFPITDKQLSKAQGFYQRYGFWSLLLSWVPIIGDPLTVMAGTLREPLWRFLLIVTLAKATRYGVVTALIVGW